MGSTEDTSERLPLLPMKGEDTAREERRHNRGLILALVAAPSVLPPMMLSIYLPSIEQIVQVLRVHGGCCVG